MYNSNDVVVINKSDKQIGIWWGHTPYFVPGKSAVPIPRVVYEACKDHKDYSCLEFVTFEQYSEEKLVADEYADKVTKNLQSLDDGESPDIVPSKSAPNRTTEPDADTDPDWDPFNCDYDEIEAYIARHNLIVDPDLSEEEIRQRIDEHMQG